MQKMISMVIDVYKFGQEFFIIVIFFGKFCTNTQKQFQLKLHKIHAKNYMQPAQKNFTTISNPDEIFQHHARIQPPYCAGQIKRANVTSVPK